MSFSLVEQSGLHEALQQKEAGLAQALRRRDGIAIEKSADQLDEVQNAADRDMASRSADLESNLLREIRAALGRIRDGCGGICVDCDEVINPRRLAAVPWAPRCVPCQEIRERHGQHTREAFNEEFAELG